MLVNEYYKLPEVIDQYELPASCVGLTPEEAPSSLTQYVLRDFYYEQTDPALRERIEAHQDFMGGMAAWRRVNGLWQRAPYSAYVDEDDATQQKGRLEWGDPVTKNMFLGDGPNGVGDEAFRRWHSLIPSAVSLLYLSDPEHVTHVFGRGGAADAAEATDLTRAWFSVGKDALGIRSRSTLMNRMFGQYIAAHEIAVDDEVRLLSVASGTALPTIQASMSAGLSNATLLLADQDPHMLIGTQGLAEGIGFEGEIEPYRMNVFDSGAMNRLKTMLMVDGEDRRPHLIDAMGIFEYTGKEFQHHTNNAASLQFDPASFLRTLYDLVRPGGRLIIGQMRAERPIPDFTMGALGWPYVDTRSVRQVMEIAHEAGIDRQQVSASFTPEGIYMIAAIDKPA